MPQSHWEKAFWAAARSSDFKPYPPEHWAKPKKKKKHHEKKKDLNVVKHYKVVGKASNGKSVTVIDAKQLGFLI